MRYYQRTPLRSARTLSRQMNFEGSSNPRQSTRLATCPEYTRVMILSGPLLSVDRLLPVSSKSQSDQRTTVSCSTRDLEPVYNLADNRKMHPQHPSCASVFIAMLPQVGRRSLCLSASSMKILNRAAAPQLAIPPTLCNPVAKAQRPA